MSRDLAEKEREFLDSLRADTGRDLAEWMAAITAEAFAHRNEAIDWLRQQGFLFSWASWMERIHHNGGRPIYCDMAEAPSEVAVDTTGSRSSRIPTTHLELSKGPGAVESQTNAKSPPHPKLRLVASNPSPRSSDADKPTVAQPSPDALESHSSAPLGQCGEPSARGFVSRQADTTPSDIAGVIASAKAFAPLAGFIVRKLPELVPGSGVAAGRRHLSFTRNGVPFAVMATSGKGLKLFFPGTPGSFPPPCEPARAAGLGISMPEGFTHMRLLNDARQIDDALSEMLREAASRMEIP